MNNNQTDNLNQNVFINQTGLNLLQNVEENKTQLPTDSIMESSLIRGIQKHEDYCRTK